jgi:ATP-dependent helicase/nuclease subunit B
MKLGGEAVCGHVVGPVRHHGAVPLTLLTGPANAGKARVVMDALRAHCARGEEPLLVVPTRADVEHYRSELARGGLGPGVRVDGFQGLLAEVIRRAGSPERPLGRLTGERVLAAVLERERGASRARGPRPSGDAPDTGRSRATPGVVRALAALVGELEVARVTPGCLREALAAWATADPAHAPRARELAGLFAEYRRALQGLGPARASPERRATRALDALRRAPALWGATPVVVYGFDDFAGLQLDAIETLGVVVGAAVTVSLAYEPGRTAFAGRGDTFQRLLPLAAEHRRLEPRADHYAPAARPALHHLERFLFEPDPPAASAGEAVRLLEGGGERAELELLAEEILGLMARGWQPGEVAVAHRSPEAVAELLGEVFRSYGIPFALQRRVRFAHTALGRALLGLLAAAFLEADDSGLGDLLAWLRAPGVLQRPELADALERRALREGASSAAQARALWEAEHWPLETLDRLREAAQRSPAELIDRTVAELERLFGGPRLPDPALRSVCPRSPIGRALTLAELTEARALAAAQAALEELRELARSAPTLAPDARELLATLRGLEVLVGEEDPGVPAVAVLDPLALRGRRVRALFLCGLQEGVFPASARPEPYLSEEERRGLAEASGLRLGRPVDALAAERYLLYAAVSRPEELLVLSWHTADDDGLPSARSLFVDDVCDLFSCDLHAARARRALGEVGEGRGSAVAGPGVAPASNGAIAPLRDSQVLAELRERRMWSASSLQTWAGCPVRWFVESLLRAQDLEPQAEPLARGGLAHAALRDVLEGLRSETGSARLVPERLPRARELLRAALAEHAGEYPLSTAPERVPGMRRRLEADLERYLEHAAVCGEGSGAEGSNGAAGAASSNGAAVAGGSNGSAHHESPLEPTHLELSFGFPDEPEALPALDLGEGVLVRGFIDRVDLTPGGEAVVYDYKGAHAPPPDRWLGERSYQVPLYMRAVEELLGAHAVGGFYQPLAGRDLRARGVLAEGEGAELPCVRGDARDPAEVRELVGEVVAAARAAATQARAGALEARPATCGFGGSGCVYPTICRSER